MEWTKIQLLIGTVDYSSWLAAQEQVAVLPDSSEIGRASFMLLDDGTMPAISEWSTVTLKGGGTEKVNLWAGYMTRQQSEPWNFTGGTARLVTLDCQSAAVRLLTTEPVSAVYGGGEPANSYWSGNATRGIGGSPNPSGCRSRRGQRETNAHQAAAR